MAGAARAPTRIGFTEARDIAAPRTTVWSLWTTPEGLASWWSPEGFVMEVLRLEPRLDGPIEFYYQEAATARDSAWREKFSRRGLSSSWSARGVFREMDPPTRLVFRQALDFGRGAGAQSYEMQASFLERAGGTRVELTALADATKHWRLLGRQNLIGQLARLAAAAERQRPGDR